MSVNQSPKKLRTVIPAALNGIRQGSTMLAVMGYTNQYGEQADFGIVFHVNYLKAVKHAISTWKNYRGLDALERQAKKDLIESYSLSLQGFNPRALSAHAYRPITDGAQLVKSVKWHDNGMAVHFWGFRVHKRVLSPGEYPIDNRSEWTVCRERLINMTALGRFRQFRIAEGQFKSIGVDHLTLTQKGLLQSIDSVK